MATASTTIKVIIKTTKEKETIEISPDAQIKQVCLQIQLLRDSYSQTCHEVPLLV